MHGNYRRRYACSRHNPFNDGRGGQISLGGGHSIGRCELHRELVGYLEAAWKSHKELTSRVSQRREFALLFAKRSWPGVAALCVSAMSRNVTGSQVLRSAKRRVVRDVALLASFVVLFGLALASGIKYRWNTGLSPSRGWPGAGRTEGLVLTLVFTGAGMFFLVPETRRALLEYREARKHETEKR